MILERAAQSLFLHAPITHRESGNQTDRRNSITFIGDFIEKRAKNTRELLNNMITRLFPMPSSDCPFRRRSPICGRYPRRVGLVLRFLGRTYPRRKAASCVGISRKPSGRLRKLSGPTSVRDSSRAEASLSIWRGLRIHNLEMVLRIFRIFQTFTLKRR